jgi:hypothetical protein
MTPRVERIEAEVLEATAMGTHVTRHGKRPLAGRFPVSAIVCRLRMSVRPG